MTMITYSMSTDTKATLMVTLRANGTEQLALASLGRVRRDDDALSTECVLSAWPVDGDGLHRVTMTDTAALIAWRCFIIAEIAAGRGLLSNHIDCYREAFGVRTRPAYEYVCVVARGQSIRPCSNAEHSKWSQGTEWVALSGNTPDPSRKWGASVWRSRAIAHEALAAVGIAMPFDRPNVWRPRATCLFVQPRTDPPMPQPQLLAPEDCDALAELV